MRVTLNPKTDAWVKAQVNAGRYNDASEVIRAALRLLQQQEELHLAKLEALRREIDAGWDELERGEFADFDVGEIDRQLDAELADERVA